MTDNRNWRDQNSRNNSNRPASQSDYRGGQANGNRNNRPNSQNYPPNGQRFNPNRNPSTQQSYRTGGNSSKNIHRQCESYRGERNNRVDHLNLQGTNLGYLFNRLLYTDENGVREYTGEAGDNQLIKKRLEQLCKYNETSFSQAQALLVLPDKVAPDTFELETQYPGLYVGLGYAHGLPGNDDDIKNGFFFDHTSGLPVIPASSVKGTLRSAFEEMPEYVLFLLQETSCFYNSDNTTVKELLNELFEGVDQKNRPLPMNHRTVFFDAYPCQCSSQGLLGFDSITPHDRKGLKEPKPIKMLKIKGGVHWKFSFRFDAKMDNDRKRALMQVFQHLLMDWGIGAKTNVGYGTLVQGKP